MSCDKHNYHMDISIPDLTVESAQYIISFHTFGGGGNWSQVNIVNVESCPDVLIARGYLMRYHQENQRKGLELACK